MYKIFSALLTIVWILDIINIPALEMLDTTYPINGLAWLLIWILVPSVSAAVSNNNNK